MENTPFHIRKHPSLQHQQHFNTHSQTNHNNPNKSCSNLLLKFLLIALFLSLLPLFPSEPPDSITHTISGPTWDLFRLLIIGILLSYGLFCFQTYPRTSPKSHISQPYFANVVNHSALSECESAIPRKSCNLTEYRSEPYVFVERNSCSNFDERPLGLPVRSLRSRVVDSDSDSDSDSDDGGDEECGSESMSNVSDGKSSCDDSSVLVGEVENRKDSMQDNGGFNGVLNMEQQQCSVESRGQYPEIWGGQDVRNSIPDNINNNNNNNNNNKCATSCFFGGFGMPFSDFSTQWNDPTNMMGNLNFDFPTVTAQPAMLNPSSEFGLRFRQPSYENVSLGNVNNGCDNAPYFMPSSVVTPPSMTDLGNGLGLRPRKLIHENVSWGQSSNRKNANMGCDKKESFMPSVSSPPSMFPRMNDLGSTSREYSHEDVSLGQSSSVESMNIPSVSIPPSMAPTVNDFASVSRRLSPECPSLGGNSPNSENVNLHSDRTEFFMPSSVAATSVSGPDREFVSPVKRIRSRKLSPENIGMVKSPKLENAALAGEKTSAFSIPVASNSPFESTPEKGFDSSFNRTRSRRTSPVTSIKKDEKGSEKDNVGNFSEVQDSHAPDFGVPLTVPTRDDLGLKNNGSSPKKGEQTSIPKKWDEDCFVIPQSDNDDIGSLHQEDHSHDVVDCSEPDLSASPSSRMSIEEEGLNQVEVEAKDTHSASANSSEIEDLGAETDSCKPPTPSPPLQKDYAREILSRISAPSPPLQRDFAREVSYKPSAPPPPPPPPPPPLPHKDFAEEICNKPSAPSPPLQKDFAREMPYKPSVPPPPLQKEFAREAPYKPSMSPPPPLQKEFTRETPYKPTISPPPPLQKEFAREAPYKPTISPPPPLQKEFARETPYKPVSPAPPPPPLQKDFARATPYKPSTPTTLPQCRARSTIASLVENALGEGSLPSDEDGEKGKTLSNASHSRRFSCGSFFDRELRKSFKDEVKKEANKKNKGVPSGRSGKCGWDCFNLDVKPASSKAALKGKSVRTIKPREIPLETNDNKGFNLDPKNDLLEVKKEENGTPSKGKDKERIGEKQEMVFIQIGISEKRSSGNGQKQGNAGTSIIVGLNPQQNSKGKASVASVVTEVKEEETDVEEIDRKADEFIAKFKEQIRLQKFGSKPESSRQQHARQSSLLYS